MPTIVYGEKAISLTDFRHTDVPKYTYPYGLDLRPGSELHDDLRDMILERAYESQNIMSSRYPSWREIDRTTTAYIRLDDDEEDLQNLDDRRPVSIVFPYSYVMIETLLTYLSTAFFQNPIFRYEGATPEDVPGAMLLELIVQMHCIKTKVALALRTIFRDALCYGFGVALPYWTKKIGNRIMKSMETSTDVFGEVSTKATKRLIEGVTVFEGNALTYADPYRFLPDPNVAIHDIQKAEYVGWVVTDNYNNLLSDEAVDELFNVRYLKSIMNKRSVFSTDQSDRSKKVGDVNRESSSDTVTSRVDTITMFLNVIPSEVGVGDSDVPEKWMFTLAADQVIIDAQRLDYVHGMYPISIASPDFDGYSPTPISRLEIMYGMQHTLNFLFNTHIANVRKAINDMIVVDPFMININDVKDPKPGKIIRARQPAWGKGNMRDYVHQLSVQDVTRTHMADSSYIAQWMERVSGADQSMMGSLRQSGPERLTRSEFQGTRASAVSRLQYAAMIISTQLMQDLGEIFAANVQQFMEQETFVSIVGRQEEDIRSRFGIPPDDTRFKINPDDLWINYDVIVKDGSIPGGNFSEAWLQLFQIIGTNEMLTQQFDVVRIFSYIASQLGAKNVEDFKRKTQNIRTETMPDEQVLGEAGRGNLSVI